MALVRVYTLLFITCLVGSTFQQKYEVPEATVELLYPTGFSVSIPGRCCKPSHLRKIDILSLDELCMSSVTVKVFINNQKSKHIKGSCYSFYYVSIRKDKEGIQLFAFHGKINEEFESRSDGGYFSRDITRSGNNRWTFTDTNTRFKLGDTINYWLFVDYFDGKNKLGYLSEFRTFTVTECPRNKVDKNGSCNAADPSTYEVPDATIEILQPRGFTVSIPDQEGIQLFAFHGNINKDFNGKESGFFSRDITSAKNGRWTFKDTDTKFNPGDTIYYWLYVVYKNKKGIALGYEKENLNYVVSDPMGSPGGCTKSATVWNGKDTCSGQLLLNEEFEFLQEQNWTREVMYADDPDYEFVIYDKYEENLFIQNNELHIKPTVADERYGEQFIYSKSDYDLGSSCTSDIAYNCKRRSIAGYVLPPVFSARIGSNNYFKYGRVDIRAKLPKGDWIYPQLFLTPKNNTYGSKDYDSGEIRVAFVSGNAGQNGVLQGMISLGTSETAREFGIRKLVKSNEGWSDNYHTFSVIWKADSIIFMVDNKEYAKIMSPTNGFSEKFLKEKPETAAKWKLGSQMAPFDQAMFIKLGVGVGGHSFPDTIPGKMYTNLEPKQQVKFYKKKDVWKPTWTKESELVIDYVKVFAL